ncbi:coenzyme F420 hydrogenase [Aliigemmobacter aestuarii]|uniref:Coenzyme F420 hydrogenase n=1 Tax=Aliigemmobacter aestuarii TaxID=1445661 RepID=A0A4V3V064_9RHOB|nr:Coenzyme F420 hydrogenase/dehydrogenase, beta subunit C-terminal domain [Gemmobacter aestuarii]THD82308.1 coenzyme F420 hydrogenase [Gemmobacter aestuarii]
MTDPITFAVQRNLCTGCGACAGLFPQSIHMIEDPVHGRRPMVKATPEGHRAAQSAARLCAGTGADFGALPRRDAIDRAWGPVLAVWQGHAMDPEIRHRGSSGGAVTALALFALQSGLAKGVAHIAAQKDDPRRNAAVISRSREGLLRGAGSRYAQASPAEALGEIAAGAEPVAFIGKPCDVATVNRATAADAALAAKIPLTIAIFCAGAPNLRATDRLLATLGMPEGAMPTALRYRGEGWPGLMQARWRDASGTEITSPGITYAKGWGEILQANRRWRCRICTDHTGAFADISVGDPWHEAPKGEAQAGRSLIVARTPRGLRLIRDAVAAGVLEASPEGRDAIAMAQPNLVAAQGAVWGRRLAMRIAGMAVPADRGLPLFAAWMALPLRAKLSSVGGTLRRIWRGRLWRAVLVQE